MTLAAALSRMTVAMIEVHERTCEIAAPHRWENCTSTPGVFAVADGLDAIDRGDPVEHVAAALHNRECQVSRCDSRVFVGGHVRSWADQARALMIHARREAPRPAAAVKLPDVREGELMTPCLCGHVKRNHSIDGRRCYYAACECAPNGGFRSASAIAHGTIST